MNTLSKKTGKMPGYIIYLFLWLFFLIIPVITNNYGAKGDFVKIRYDWLRMLPFFIVFLINSFLLLPNILFLGYTKIYLFSLLVCVTAITGLFQVIGPELYRNDPKLMEQRILQDPQYGRDEMMPGGSRGQIPGNAEIFSPSGRPKRSQGNSNPPFIQFMNTFLISLLIAGFNTAIAATNKWVDEEQSRKEVEKEHIRSELDFLQSQISPHFFMNTLNNIHALIEADQELAQNAVIKLSELMRYLLYESGRGNTTLKKEVEFLKSYINLMQLRVDNSVKVDINMPDVHENVNLPPLLFISFIENAFKHGVSYREPSHLAFTLTQNSGTIEFISVNTILSTTSASKSHGGIGLENIRKRLDLLYSDKFSLDIRNDDNQFMVRLTIPSVMSV
jgi:hypothetical protein